MRGEYLDISQLQPRELNTIKQTFKLYGLDDSILSIGSSAPSVSPALSLSTPPQPSPSSYLISGMHLTTEPSWGHSVDKWFANKQFELIYKASR
jgi:hypothetical protein